MVEERIGTEDKERRNICRRGRKKRKEYEKILRNRGLKKEGRERKVEKGVRKGMEESTWKNMKMEKRGREG